VYHKDLDRSCTHLISAFPTRDPKAKTSEKIKWALKEIGDREMQRRRGKRVDGEDIRIVYEEWIWDCVAFSGRWKEEGYDARKPRATGKVKYEDVIDGTAFLPVEEKKPEGEHDDDEPVVVKKRKRENIHNLVGELLSTTTPLERKPTEVELLPAMDADKGSAPPEEELPSRSSVFDRKASVLHASRSTAFAATSGVSRSGLLASATSEPDAEPEHTSKRQRTPSFFSGLRISHAIAEGYEGLENALHQHGATIVTEQERLAGAPVDYVVTRL
jgi:DNA replication regulator DPB11